MNGVVERSFSTFAETVHSQTCSWPLDLTEKPKVFCGQRLSQQQQKLEIWWQRKVRPPIRPLKNGTAKTKRTISSNTYTALWSCCLSHSADKDPEEVRTKINQMCDGGLCRRPCRRYLSVLQPCHQTNNFALQCHEMDGMARPSHRYGWSGTFWTANISCQRMQTYQSSKGATTTQPQPRQTMTLCPSQYLPNKQCLKWGGISLVLLQGQGRQPWIAWAQLVLQWNIYKQNTLQPSITWAQLALQWKIYKQNMSYMQDCSQMPTKASRKANLTWRIWTTPVGTSQSPERWKTSYNVKLGSWCHKVYTTRRLEICQDSMDFQDEVRWNKEELKRHQRLWTNTRCWFYWIVCATCNKHNNSYHPMCCSGTRRRTWWLGNNYGGHQSSFPECPDRTRHLH